MNAPHQTAMTTPEDPLDYPTAIVAEDEPILRQQFVARLQELWPELNIVGEAQSGDRAVELFEQHQPDIAFLDIQMPVMTGLQAAAVMAGRCHVVFVTAFDQYAVEAFTRGAVDYVLKPINRERLSVTIERLQQRLAQPDNDRAPSAEPLRTVLTDLGVDVVAAQQRAPRLRWIKASSGPHVRLIETSDVLYFHSQDKYTKVVTVQGTQAYIRKTIKELETELDPELFWQVHRATIVNVRAIESVSRDADKDSMLLKVKGTGEVLIVSRAYTHLFKGM